MNLDEFLAIFITIFRIPDRSLCVMPDLTPAKDGQSMDVYLDRAIGSEYQLQHSPFRILKALYLIPYTLNLYSVS
jgi:hypothetical protein